MDTTAARRLLDAPEVATILDVGTWRIYELARTGALPSVRIGRTVRFDHDAIDAWIRAGGTATEADR